MKVKIWLLYNKITYINIYIEIEIIDTTVLYYQGLRRNTNYMVEVKFYQYKESKLIYKCISGIQFYFYQVELRIF